jgi:hypothetical protein
VICASASGLGVGGVGADWGQIGVSVQRGLGSVFSADGVSVEHRTRSAFGPTISDSALSHSSVACSEQRFHGLAKSEIGLSRRTSSTRRGRSEANKVSAGSAYARAATLSVRDCLNSVILTTLTPLADNTDPSHHPTLTPITPITLTDLHHPSSEHQPTHPAQHIHRRLTRLPRQLLHVACLGQRLERRRH